MLLLSSLLVPLLATVATAEYYHVVGTDFEQYVAGSNFQVEPYDEVSAYGIPPPPGGVDSFAVYLTDLTGYSQTTVYKIPSTGIVHFIFTFFCDGSGSELEIRMSYPWQDENIYLCGPSSNIHQPGEWVTGTFSRNCSSTCSHLDLWIYGGTLGVNNIVGLQSMSITTDSSTFPPTDGTTFVTDSTTTTAFPTTATPPTTTTTTPTTTVPTTTAPTTTTPTPTTPTTTTPTTTTPTTTTPTTTTPTTTTPITTKPTTTTPTTTIPTTTTPTTTTPTTTTPTTTTPTTTTPTTTTPTTTIPTTTTPTTTTPTTTTPTTTTPTTNAPTTTTPTTTTPSTTTPTTTTPTTTTPTTTTPTTTTPTTTTPTTTTPTTTTPTTTTPTTTTPTTTTPTTTTPTTTTPLPVYWPAGKYGLTKSIRECPDNWLTGYSEQDTEGNDAYDSSYLAGWVHNNRIRKEFCMQNGNGSGNWPAGNYCIYRYGGSCPNGFNGGYLNWEDRDFNGHNSFGGYRPDGVWDEDHTTVQYCCRNDGSYNNEIILPTEDPFILLRNTPVCQKVRGMTSRTQFIKYDTENTDDDSYTYGDHPYICTYNEGCYTSSDQPTEASDIQVHFCYYY